MSDENATPAPDTVGATANEIEGGPGYGAPSSFQEAPKAPASPDGSVADGTRKADTSGPDTPGADVYDALTYDLPDGLEMDSDALEGFKGLCARHGIPAEAAQDIAAFQAARDRAAWESHEQQKADWAREAREDPELGGQGFQENLGVAKQAFETFAPPDVQELLNTSGLGNHPGVIRMFFRIGQNMGEDRRISGGAGKGVAPGLAERMYPNEARNN